MRRLGKRTEVNGQPRCVPESDKLKVHRNSQTEIGIETIRCEQSIVTISILGSLEILKFEGDKARIKTLTTLVLTRATVRSKKNPTLLLLS